ncbi:MAG: hypothetical protein KatS3mg051_2108 [Anaerolineae bacterium]|nr:MAG: hypothetical protein KatS3mg051_2108 [Anaerolineae bacterium]
MPGGVTNPSNALVSMTPSGFTVRSGTGNPRLEIGSTGIKGYDSSGTQTLNIDTAGRLTLESGSGVKIRLTTSGAPAANGFFIENGSNPVVALRGDGSGRLGLNGEITWDVINGLSITASAIKTGTLNCQNLTVTNLSVSNITGGTIGGNYATGSNKIIFGDDYLTDNIIHFKVPTQTAVIRFRPLDDDSFPSGYNGRGDDLGMGLGDERQRRHPADSELVQRHHGIGSSSRGRMGGRVLGRRAAVWRSRERIPSMLSADADVAESAAGKHQRVQHDIFID